MLVFRFYLLKYFQVLYLNGGYYVFIKPYLKTILDALIDDGKKRKSQQEKAIYSLFALYDVNDFTKIDEASAKERTRSLLNKIR